MPVNLLPPDPAHLLPISGVRLGTAEAGIKKAHRKDVTVIALDEGTRLAGVFTQNAFCAAPVHVCRDHLNQQSAIRGLVINTGNANAGTGEPGLAHARAVCSAVAQALDCRPEQILPFSTGVIIEPLPVEKVIAGIPAAVADLAAEHWANAAEAIMTTDIVAKGCSRRVQLGAVGIQVTGIAKGSGMIHPNMATMLAFIATDAAISQPLVEKMLREACDVSFNRVTVDGDTSTNDSFLLFATGHAKNDEITDAHSPEYQALAQAVTAVATELAQALARDGEGATKFISIEVEEGATTQECADVAFSIAHSPLVKTAFFASDPNLGRILMAIGKAGLVDFDTRHLQLYLDDVQVTRDGGRDPHYREEDGQRVMAKAEITIRVCLGRGAARTTVWTCDYSYDYVKINADYRS